MPSDMIDVLILPTYRPVYIYRYIVKHTLSRTSTYMYLQV